VKVVTWNVNGVRAREAQLQEFIEREQPDVLCLQEIKASVDQLPTWMCEIEGYWCYWHGGKGYSGVALHVSKALAPERPAFEHPAFDYENRIVLAKLPQATFASVYVPNGGKDYAAKLRFMESLIGWAKRLHGEGRNLILCGDINIARSEVDVHPVERKPHLIGQRPEERALFERLLGEHLVDVGRAKDPANERLFTWWPPWRNMRARNMGWRLDYILASEPLASRAESCKVLSEVGTSDHAPVMMITG
jgi:exodeoxyribonuclease III